ncbi:MAG: GHKL domain-containing protein [Planctomycetes bacterium]|nr:GHKL domain-containing protein [Planctomycetota bacterium]
MNTGSSRVRRWTMVGLAVAAGSGVLVALLFVQAWGGYLSEFEPGYFRDQGLAWGNAERRRLEAYLDRFLEESPHADVRQWPMTLPQWIRPRLNAELDREKPGHLARLALIDRRRDQAVFLWPAGPPALSLSMPMKLESSGFRVAVERQDDGRVRVELESELEARTPLDQAYMLQGSLVFNRLDLGLDRGRTLAWALVLAYLAILYLLLILVYFLGRREMRLAFAAAERAIRLKAIGSVAEGIAHEVRNPLNAISLSVQYIEMVPDKLGHPAAPEDFQRVYTELGKIRKVIDNFVGFTRLREIELSDWDAIALVDEVLEDFAPRFSEHEIEVQVHRRGSAELTADRPKLRRVLQSILRNAVEAVAGTERRLIQVTVDGESRRVVRISIRDSGPAADRKTLENMFDPYFTTRSSAMGLGLTLAKTVVESHGGVIQAAAAQGGGCAVVIEIPRRL